MALFDGLEAEDDARLSLAEIALQLKRIANSMEEVAKLVEAVRDVGASVVRATGLAGRRI